MQSIFAPKLVNFDIFIDVDTTTTLDYVPLWPAEGKKNKYNNCAFARLKTPCARRRKRKKKLACEKYFRQAGAHSSLLLKATCAKPLPPTHTSPITERQHCAATQSGTVGGWQLLIASTAGCLEDIQHPSVPLASPGKTEGCPMHYTCSILQQFFYQ